MSRAACTIVSPNYLAYARTLSASYLRQHPDDEFFVLIVADLADAVPFQGDRFTPVMLGEIGLKDLRGEAMKYEILELNTNVKPSFLKYLLQQRGFDSVIYLDPDLFVYSPLEPVFKALLDGANAVLTPHLTTPLFDGKLPGEQEMLFNGSYNLGFIAVAGTDEGFRLLDWWEERCLKLGFSEGRTGLFVDQKWMNLAPGLFTGVSILRDAGCNMAYWNLHERRLEKGESGYEVVSPVSGRVPLRFFHFSGIVISDPEILSKNTDRYTLAMRPDLQELFAAYKASVANSRKPAEEGLPFGFDRMSDGTALTRLARRIYAEHQHHFSGTDPFDAKGAFAAFARRERLLAGPVSPAKSTWKEFNPNDRRVRAVHALLKLALRVLGPNRYELLMRYLGHITVLRNQAAFLRDRSWSDPQSLPGSDEAP